MNHPIVFSSDAPKIGRVAGLSLAAQRTLLLGLRALPGRLGRPPRTAKYLLTGERGELEALFFLRRQGYRIVERRWRADGLRGDLDLIGWDGETLCFVEVKARTKRDFAPARSGVDRDKQRMLRQMARAYRGTLPRPQRRELSTRFDVVSVYLLEEKVECELARGVFSWKDEPDKWTF